MDGVYLNEESLTQISRLFKVSSRRQPPSLFTAPSLPFLAPTSVLPAQIIDRNSDGKLDIHDFSLNGVITDTHYQKWTELRDKFDFDGDGLITMDEV